MRRYHAANRDRVRAARAAWYADNRDELIAKALQGKRVRWALGRAVADGELAKGCLDCGEKDQRVLDFDHVRGIKAFTISDHLDLSPARLYAEIDKCEVRCANCHRRVTADRRAQQMDRRPN